MSRLKGMSLILSLLFVNVGAIAQTERDVAAIGIINNAIQALGGSASVLQITDCTVQGSIQIGADASAPIGNFTFMASKNGFRYGVQFPNGEQKLFLSGTGTPVSYRNGVAHYPGSQVARAALPFYVPGFVLAAELANPNYSVTLVGQETRNGISVTHIHTVDTSDEEGSKVTHQDWYFDSTTSLPVAVEYRIPDDIDLMKFAPGSDEFSDYRPVNGVLVPFAIRASLGGSPKFITVSSVAFNTGISPLEFTGGAQ